MNIENSFLKAKCLNFHYQYPSLDTIGYDNLKSCICVYYHYFISAHAPSVLSVVFKRSEKVYINCNYNRNTAVAKEPFRYIIKTKDKILLDTQDSMQYHSLNVVQGEEYFFEIQTNNSYGAHTIWAFYHPHSQEEMNSLEQRSLEDANKYELDPKSDYSVFIQTCNPRKKMAFRCVTSLLNNIERPPNRIVMCSIDEISDGPIVFPKSVEILCGQKRISQELNSQKISNRCIQHIFNGFPNNGNPTGWLKYIIPRLCMKGQRVLVLDDDVAVLGKCSKLLNSKSYLTFMEDDDPLYGERTIDYFNKHFKTNIYGKHKPFVCAGAYMLDHLKYNHESKFIDGLILASLHGSDEQSAVGMEIISNKDFTLLTYPEYHHGGWRDQKIDLNKLEFIHMQGRVAGYRENLNFINFYMKKRRHGD